MGYVCHLCNIYAGALNFDLMHDCLLQKNKSIFCGFMGSLATWFMSIKHGALRKNLKREV